MVTVTLALRAVRRRTDGSTTPTFTSSVTVDVAPATEIGSVIASLSARTAVAGPAITTATGSLTIFSTWKPGAGSPSTVGATGTSFAADGSNVIARLDGVTCTTSTPNG